jgi:hypothetical protein
LIYVWIGINADSFFLLIMYYKLLCRSANIVLMGSFILLAASIKTIHYLLMGTLYGGFICYFNPAVKLRGLFSCSVRAYLLL